MAEPTGIQLAGSTFIPSRTAAQAAGYTQDYVGQLARAGLIEARRMGGLWYVSLDSLKAYKQKAESYVPQPPQNVRNELDTIVSFDGRDYLSASRAAYITGYNQDYVGQLARSGEVLARQVGSRWYIERTSIIEHKREKDALLAAVQARSVGIFRQDTEATKKLGSKADNRYDTYLKYTKETGDLMPIFEGSVPHTDDLSEPSVLSDYKPIPIRVIDHDSAIIRNIPLRKSKSRSWKGKKTYSAALVGALAATIVIFLAIGLAIDRGRSIYTNNLMKNGSAVLPAAAYQAARGIGDVLERVLTRELIYIRR